MDSATVVCSICDKALHDESNDVTNVRTKGLQTLTERSKLIGDNKWTQWDGLSVLVVHGKCRKWYALASKKSAIARAMHQIPREPSTSSEDASSTVSGYAPTVNDFSFRQLCFICGKPWRCKNRPSSLVRHEHAKETILAAAVKRNDSSGSDVINRLEGIRSLVSVGARYHAACWRNFKRIAPKMPESETKQSRINATFKLVSDYIEASNVGKFKLSELREEMGEKGLSPKVLYRKLNEKYGDDIYILHQNGTETLIFYKNDFFSLRNTRDQ